MKKPKTTDTQTAKTAPKKVIVTTIPGHKPTPAFLAALKAVAAMGEEQA